jgi:hypothetical protein
MRFEPCRARYGYLLALHPLLCNLYLSTLHAQNHAKTAHAFWRSRKSVGLAGIVNQKMLRQKERQAMTIRASASALAAFHVRSIRP